MLERLIRDQLLLKLNSLSDTIMKKDIKETITLLLKLNSLSDTIDPPLPVDLYSKSGSLGGYLCDRALKITSTDLDFFAPYALRSEKIQSAHIVDQ
jgi:hypothetical protein